MKSKMPEPKRYMIRKFIAVLILAGAHFVALGQENFAQQYQNAKDLFREGEYNLAMESFKPLIPYNQNNPYSAYASFYYALSAQHLGYDAVAKDMFLQIRTTYPQWDKLPEVNLWLGTIYLRQGEYFQGMKVLDAIRARDMRDVVAAIKQQYLGSIEDMETLSMLAEEHPRDEVIGRMLAKTLAANLQTEGNKERLDSLIKAFRFERGDYIPEAPETFHKDRYAVGVLLPFMLGELDASPGKKRNQIILDFYEGIRLAIDSLNQTTPPISLRAYDTDKGLEHLQDILLSPELRNTDLVIGPLFSNEAPFVRAFSQHQQVNAVNPFSNNSELVVNNPYAFLFQPAAETLGTRAAQWLAENESTRNERCLIFAGTTRNDSAMVASFISEAQERGLEIVGDYRFPREEAGEIINILATATEYDEFKYPSEFTLKKDSIGSIFVASDDPLIYTKVISGVETRGDSILVLGSADWVDDTAVPFEKYQHLGVTFMAPAFVAVDDPARHRFLSRYLATYGKLPSKLSIMGYELMLFFGHQLKTGGVYFQDGLFGRDVLPGYMYQGFYYPGTHDNQLVPFVRFEDGALRLIDIGK